MAEGGEERIGRGTVDISEEEERLLHALHLLGIKPQLGTMEDVTKLLQVFGGVKKEPQDIGDAAPRQTGYHFPRLPIFFGEENKGDVNWTSFRYEIEALARERVFSEEQIILGIRRSCKGKAADNLRRLGPEVQLHDILHKFNSDYGSVESREMTLKKFYSCQQSDDESVTSYASRLEEIFDQAIHLQALRRRDQRILREVFHAGLRKELRLMSVYQFDKIDNYDELKREIRRLESTLTDNINSSEQKKTCKASVTPDLHSKEMTEVKELLTKLNDRIDKLEKEKTGQSQQQGFRGRGRGFRGFRGFRSRGRGRGNYQPQRPVASSSFQPTCWTCNQRGHLQRDCPSNAKALICYNCNEPGHKQQDCPKE